MWNVDSCVLFLLCIGASPAAARAVAPLRDRIAWDYRVPTRPHIYIEFFNLQLKTVIFKPYGFFFNNFL